MREVSHTAFIGLGGNLGDVEATLHSALAALAALPGTRLLRVSSFYRTAPVGGIEQADFTNAAAEISTTLTAPELLQALLSIEREHGRDRSREVRWGPRRLDLDLLLYGQMRLDLPGLEVPHPRMAERRFVLEPLHEIAPKAFIPGQGVVAEVLARLDAN